MKRLSTIVAPMTQSKKPNTGPIGILESLFTTTNEVAINNECDKFTLLVDNIGYMFRRSERIYAEKKNHTEIYTFSCANIDYAVKIMDQRNIPVIYNTKKKLRVVDHTTKLVVILPMMNGNLILYDQVVPGADDINFLNHWMDKEISQIIPLLQKELHDYEAGTDDSIYVTKDNTKVTLSLRDILYRQATKDTIHSTYKYRQDTKVTISISLSEGCMSRMGNITLSWRTIHGLMKHIVRSLLMERPIHRVTWRREEITVPYYNSVVQRVGKDVAQWLVEYPSTSLFDVRRLMDDDIQKVVSLVHTMLRTYANDMLIDDDVTIELDLKHITLNHQKNTVSMSPWWVLHTPLKIGSLSPLTLSRLMRYIVSHLMEQRMSHILLSLSDVVDNGNLLSTIVAPMDNMLSTETSMDNVFPWRIDEDYYTENNVLHFMKDSEMGIDQKSLGWHTFINMNLSQGTVGFKGT